jgi:Ran GTPase-activating protein (RanGAP) involved in mRNA processing and transport
MRASAHVSATLIAVVLLGKQITDLGEYRNPKLEEIIRASKVRGRLLLDSMNLNDQDMEIVVKLGIVEKKSHDLSLSHNAITSVGVSILSQVFLNGIPIYALNLNGNQILDAGVQFLCRGLANQTMGTKFLYLNSIGISDTGCECLAEMLQVHHSIIYLHLEENQISDRGVRVLLETITSSDSMVSLIYLSGNNLITDGSVDIISSTMFKNRHFHQLHLRNCALSPAGKERLQIAAQQTSFILYV